MKKIVLLCALLFSVSCATINQPQVPATPINDIATNLNMDLLTSGYTSFVNIENQGLPTLEITMAVFSADNKNTLATTAIAESPSTWIWVNQPSVLYGGLMQETIPLEGKNFELIVFTQSGKNNIYSDLFPKGQEPKTWLVCQMTRIDTLTNQKTILDYREVTQDATINSNSSELLAFQKRAVASLEKTLAFSVNSINRKNNPALATRFLGGFVGPLNPKTFYFFK